MRVILLLVCCLRAHPIPASGRRYMRSRSALASLSPSPASPLMIVPGNDPSLEWSSFPLPGNGIPVVICRDPSSLKASASLAVKVGAASDPPNMAGLAHFTEHAVFLGSEKYPVENSYKDFLNKNGGSSNAATGMESTVYKFEINAISFSHALDLFSQFFKRPLFSIEAIAREIMAVDSEDSKNRILDGRRTLQVMKDLLLPGHRYKKFSTGNVGTIAGGDAVGNAKLVSAEMRRFHEEHYRPENMALCLCGPQDLLELRRLATEMFDDIRSFDGGQCGGVAVASSPRVGAQAHSSSSVSVSDSFPFKEGGLLVRLRPIKDLRSLSVVWSVPPTRSLYKNDPTLLLGYLLSHKGKGSLFSQLQSRGLVISLDASESTQFEDFSLFEVTLGLTQKGLANYQQALTLVYEHIAAVQRADDNQLQTYWAELRDILFLKFKYLSKSSPYELTQSASKDMLFYGVADAFSAGWLLDEQLDVHSFRDCARLLSIGRSINLLKAREFEQWLPGDGAVTAGDVVEGRIPLREAPNRLEPWYGVPYHAEPISLSLPPPTDATLPPPNEYVSDELVRELRAAEQESGSASSTLAAAARVRSSPPMPVSSAGHHDVAFSSADEVFKQPKSIVYCLVHAPSTDNLHPVYSLLGSLFDQLTVSKYYSAGVAGLQHGVSVSSRGISSYVAGFSSADTNSSKLGLLLQSVLRDFTDPQLWAQPLGEQSELLADVKERLVRGLRGWSKERPDSQCDAIVSYVLSERGYLPAERLRQAEEITPAMARDALRRLRANIRTVSTYAHGNLAGSDVAALHSRVLPLVAGGQDRSFADESMPRGRLLRLGNVRIKLPTFNPDDENSAVVVHIQTGEQSPASSAFLLLLRRFIGEPLFAELRTSKQLGYVVSASTSGYGRGMRSVRGLTISVLSKRFDPDHIMEEVESFLAAQKAVFARLTQEQVTQMASAIVLSLQEPPKSYLEEAADFHESLMADMPFDWRERVISELQAVRVETFCGQVLDLVLDSSKRRSVAVMMYGSKAVVDRRARDGETVLASLEEVAALVERLEYF